MVLCTGFQLSFMVSVCILELQGKRGIWIKLPIELANLVEVVVKVHFVHTQKKLCLKTYMLSVLKM